MRPSRREQDFFEDDVPQEGPALNLWQTIDSTDRVPSRRPLWTILTLSTTVAVLISVLWYSYPREVEIRNQLSAPVLHADAQPARVAPDEPGGMDIPHRDSAVFDAINTAEAAETPSVENLLAAEEEPMPKARLFAGLNTDTIDSNNTSSPQDSAESSRGAEPAPAATTQTTQTSPPPESAQTPTSDSPAIIEDIRLQADRTAEKVLKTLPQETESQGTSSSSNNVPPTTARGDSPSLNPQPVRPIAASSAAQKSSPVQKTQKAAPSQTPRIAEDRSAKKVARIEPAAGAALGSATKGTYFIQLSSVRERGRADAEWSSLKRQFPGQLGALGMRIQKADLGAKGTYYRIQAGPVSKDQASSLCSAIKRTKPGGCLIVGQ